MIHSPSRCTVVLSWGVITMAWKNTSVRWRANAKHYYQRVEVRSTVSSNQSLQVATFTAIQ
jgi:hypothetical protein